MKKLFLIAATSTALLTSIASFANSGQFYLKAQVGATNLGITQGTFEDGELERTKKRDVLKLKSKTGGIFGAGAGYHVMDNMRAELTLDILVNPGFVNSCALTSRLDNPKSYKTTAKKQVVLLLINDYIDLYDADFAKLFVGAGVGMAQIKEKMTFRVAENNEKQNNPSSAIKKPANNFAYQLTAGAAFPLVDGVSADLRYSWMSLGETNDTNKDTEKLPKTTYQGHSIVVGIRFDI